MYNSLGSQSKYRFEKFHRVIRDLLKFNVLYTRSFPILD